MKKVKALLGLACTVMLFFSLPLYADEIGRNVKITYLGHAAFQFVSPKGVVIYVDPFLSKNPKTPPAMKTVEKADLVLVTHGHGDHLGDTLSIAEKTNATVVAIAELGRYLKKKGLKNVIGMNKGGSFLFQGIKITMVNAFHSSSVEEEGQIIYAGEPAGFIIGFENGFSVYHAGDTSVFGDMKILRDLYKPEMSLLPIGSHYTMDPKEATYAAKLLQSKYVIPMHYGTFGALTGTVEDFLELMKDVPGTKVLALKPGESFQ